MFNYKKQKKEMKKAISIIRITILVIMGGVGTILLFGEEQEDAILSFLLHVLIDKMIGLALVVATCMLFRRWRKLDNWLKAIDEWCVE